MLYNSLLARKQATLSQTVNPPSEVHIVKLHQISHTVAITKSILQNPIEQN